MNRNIMRDTMLVNVSGLPGHWMGIDMNIEHLIRYLKALFAAKGIYSNWERLGNISAGINWLHRIKKQVTRSMKSGYYGSSHKDVNISPLVIRVANKASELGLQEYSTERAEEQHTSFTDIMAAGYKKFESTSLQAFNLKIANFQEGSANDEDDPDDEPDTIRQNEIIEIEEDELAEADNENGEQESALHDSED
ncbi:hypothetical protein DFP72DRAFT_1142625 [Ephemerocybe angulata]|uniref:DUF6589 domain-containing protein n=1 Tax=Ephemerocybe angulata TaxID=980116 RepID=A0A8H6HNI3_9AGAR|nr:hypothetical protein DFP72DRAFT_1142613 [Tulosesus angulatus]KAF6749457.1 hypothetical protein DFP72DRAFT_1142625 [Tulosesus angulatus]